MRILHYIIILVSIFLFSIPCIVLGQYPDIDKSWNGDSNACWNASTANILQYTSWTTGAQQVYNNILSTCGNYTADIDRALKVFKGLEGGYPVTCQWLGPPTYLTVSNYGGTATDTWINQNRSYIPRDNNLKNTLIQKISESSAIYLQIYVPCLGSSHAISLWYIDSQTGNIKVSDSDSDNSDAQYMLKQDAGGWYIENYKYRNCALAKAYLENVAAFRSSCSETSETLLQIPITVGDNTVNFQAGHQIRLLPGFSVSVQGSGVFRAYIQPCN